MKKIISIVVGLTATIFPSIALAQSTNYTFNQNIENVYISRAEMNQTSSEALVRLYGAIPTCANQYYLTGEIVVSYTNGNAWFRRSQGLSEDSEGLTGYIGYVHAEGYYGDPGNGNLNISVSSTCEFKGLNRPEDLLNPDWWRF